MHQLLDDYLCKKYPKIFCDRNKSEMESCMHWGLAVGNGWFSLLDNVCRKIQYHIDNPPYDYDEEEKVYRPATKPTCSQLVALQVKEKFGGLRFYTSGGDEYIRALVDEAEELSYSICEECGRMDDDVGRNRKGWIQTTCREHAHNPNDFTPNNHSELGKIWEQVKEDEKKRKEKAEAERKEWAKKNWKDDGFY
jgi:hypothetical protein